MAYRDSTPASISAGGPPSSPSSPLHATAARARLSDGEPRHGARGAAESAERERGRAGPRGSAGSAQSERDRDVGVRHREYAARNSAAAGAPRAARSSSAAAGDCGARRGWGRHLTGRVIDGGMAHE